MALLICLRSLRLTMFCLLLKGASIVNGQFILYIQNDNLAERKQDDPGNVNYITELQDGRAANIQKDSQLSQEVISSLTSQTTSATVKQFKNVLSRRVDSHETSYNIFPDKRCERNDTKLCLENEVNDDNYCINNKINSWNNDTWSFHIIDFIKCMPCICRNVLGSNNIIYLLARCKTNSTIEEIIAALRKDTSVIDLYITNSKVDVFKAKHFLVFQFLETLKISGNSNLSKIKNNTKMHPMRSIKLLDLSDNKIKSVQDNSFMNMPDLLCLDLSRNMLTHISNFTFKGICKLQILNLASNVITVIESGSFDYFQQLKILDLSKNRNLVYRNRIPPLVLCNLKSLTQLYIQGNIMQQSKYPNKVISELSNLTTLHIDGIEGISLGPEIRTLTHLVNLYIGLENKCTLKNITDNFFLNVPYLKVIKIMKCPLENISLEAYTNFIQLTQLELISATHDFDMACGSLIGLQNSSLKSLSLIDLRHNIHGCISLSQKHVMHLRYIHLEYLDLSNNNIAYIKSEFMEQLPLTLMKFVLRGNKLIEPHILVDKLQFLQQLDTIDIGAKLVSTEDRYISCSRYFDEVVIKYNSKRIDKLSLPEKNAADTELEFEDALLEVVSRSPETENRVGFYRKNSNLWHIPSNLNNDTASFSDEITNLRNKAVDTVIETHDQGPRNEIDTTIAQATMAPLNHMKIPPNLQLLLAPKYININIVSLMTIISESQTNSLKEIDFSFCNLGTLGQTPVIPQSLSRAIFDGNHLTSLSLDLFQSNNSLIYLSLKNNILGQHFANKDRRQFTELNQLQYLDISFNMIYDLPIDFFKGLQSLKYLIMIENRIEYLNTRFNHTPSLQYINLQKISLSSISKVARDDLDLIASSHSLYIDICDNPLRCTCDGLEMLQWICTSKIQFLSSDYLRCIVDGNDTSQDVGKIEERVLSLQRYCAAKAIILIICVASLIVIISLISFGLMYRYRWRLRYIQNIALSRIFGFKTRLMPSSRYKFDAYILYSDSSREFVLEECRHELEVKRGRKLCIDDRDFMPGSYTVSAIVSAIQNSRKTVVIVTPDIYDEEYYEYAVKMAIMEEIHTKRKVIYLCVCQFFSDDQLSICQDLLMVMKRNCYTECPLLKQISEEIRHAFWDQLSLAIGPAAHEDLRSSLDLSEGGRDGEPGPTLEAQH